MPRNHDAMPLPTVPDEAASGSRKPEKRRHLKLVTEEDVPTELTEADIIPPTVSEEAQAHMDKERAHMDEERAVRETAEALGREQRDIREAQAQHAVEEAYALIAKHEAAERDKASGFGAEKTMKPPAKIASLLDRVKGWFR